MESPPSVSSKVSYAQMIQNIQVPTKEQAIVLDAVDGLSVSTYTLAIGKITEPANIKYISRISNGRVCIYLNSKETADTLIGRKVNIGPHSLEIRPLVTRAKRIIISNACPIIPNETILWALAQVNVTPCSQITYIRAGINEPGFSYVLSFRRQMYVNPEDLQKLPPSICINLGGTKYYIYLSAEKMTCFVCNEEGHTAKHCQNVNTTAETQIENLDIETTTKTQTENSALQVNSSQQNNTGSTEPDDKQNNESNIISIPS